MLAHIAQAHILGFLNDFVHGRRKPALIHPVNSRQVGDLGRLYFVFVLFIGHTAILTDGEGRQKTP